jgi:hypothetical protein
MKSVAVKLSNQLRSITMSNITVYTRINAAKAYLTSFVNLVMVILALPLLILASTLTLPIWGDSAAELLVSNNVVSQEYFELYTMPANTRKELVRLRSEHKQLHDLAVATGRENTRLSAELAESNRKLSAALVPEASVKELVDTRVVAPAQQHIVSPSRDFIQARLEAAKEYIHAKGWN